MTPWSNDELAKIGTTEELQLASLREDGKLRKPVTIWVVRVDNDLFVRAARGRIGAWFRSTLVRHEGHILAGGVDKDVTFVEEADAEINTQIDIAYRTKYRQYDAQYVDPMVAPQAKAATIKLLPRSA
jgi:hypothetical protein